MPRRRLWASTPLLLLLLVPALAAVESDFSFYPAGAQSCLNQAAAASKCGGATVQDLNKCLCGNGGNFVLLAAACLGKDDKADSVTVYTTMVSACANSNTPLDVAPSDFYGAVNGLLPTTTASTSTSTSTEAATTDIHVHTTVTVTPTSTSTSTSASTSTGAGTGADTVGDNLSTGATVGIALGASFGGVGAIAGLVYFLLRRSKKQGEEFHPMLPQFGDEVRFSQGAFDPTPSPGLSSSFTEAKRASWVSPLQSPDPYRYSAAAWDPSQGMYAGPYPPPEGAVGLPPPTASGNNAGMVFEMDATSASRLSQQQTGVAEVPGDVPFTRQGGRL
ncbi:hypothetical protein Trco_003256 [Trichoderma cornu-damae]|uniref:Extracellular membrane protein CFEM domain-containing protein n=1 Tax=Trichoderma cornu-damae TaxID=654480 RepID=A0A9P8QQZ8_9HYPO|nr:hypothetical protein Trco_003256 [Trichoderma cornu-damae]